MKLKLGVNILVVSLPFKITIPKCHDIKNLTGALYALMEHLDEKLNKNLLIKYFVYRVSEIRICINIYFS